MSSRGGASVGVVREEIREAVSAGEPAASPGSLALPEAVPEYLRDAAKVALSRGGHYVWGGQSPEGFDCSGLMCYLYHAAGIRLPRRSSDQAIKGELIERQDLVAGDLVFFARQGRVFHVGMYLGNGRFFHAANPKRGLTVDALDGPFYGRLYACGRRYIGTGITDYSVGMPTTPDPRDPEASQVGE
jgi:cell wall-associated NlpC family hydrolase